MSRPGKLKRVLGRSRACIAVLSEIGNLNPLSLRYDTALPVANNLRQRVLAFVPKRVFTSVERILIDHEEKSQDLRKQWA